MIYILYQNILFDDQIEYTFKVFMSALGVDWKIAAYNKANTLINQPDDIFISYGKAKPAITVRNQIHIYESDFFGDNYLKPDSLPPTPLARLDNIPIIWRGERSAGQTSTNSAPEYFCIETESDIVASSFFMLTRYEEVLKKERDEHGRFPARASLAWQEGFLDRPIVNEYLGLLWSWIQELAPNLQRKPLWPDGKQFAVCLTHDVDAVKKYASPPLAGIKHLLIDERKPWQTLQLVWDYLKVILHIKPDSFNTFNYLLSMERKYGINSSFYFMTDGSSYDIASRDVRKLITTIESAGDEVGLHASYHTAIDPALLSQEKGKLDGIVANKNYGCRHHYLRITLPDTWRIQESAGLLYDTTLTFADHAGFRCGFCLPFHPFDLVKNRELDIWELPLTVMEGSLQNPNYQNLDPESALDQITHYIETIKNSSGVFVILWHNSSFDPLTGWSGWGKMYEKLLTHICTENTLSSNGREIIEHWRRR